MAAAFVMFASATGAGGLTLRRFNNTALAGTAIDTIAVSSLESTKAFGAPGTSSQPSSLLITGRLAPPTAGRYGFAMTFSPALPFPSADAYARLWVDDHLLHPHNSTVSGWGGGIAPKWIPLPPRALDGDGKTVEVPGAKPLGSYEVRLEYVCMSSHCPTNQTISLRWASFQMTGDGGDAPFIPIPPTVLMPTQSDPEIRRRQLRTTLESGWGTFDHTSSLSWVLLPESLTIGAAFYSKSTGALIGPKGLTVFKLGMSAAHPTTAYAGGFTLRLGYHSVDQSYTEAWLDWGGTNISIATAVDPEDNSQLTLVVQLVSSSSADDSESENTDNTGNSSSTATTHALAPASDVALLLIPSFANGRAGSVSASNTHKTITAMAAGLRTSTLHVLQGDTFQLPATPVNASVALPSVYVGIELSGSSSPIVVTTNAKTTATAAISEVAASRAEEVRKLGKYGREWSDVKVGSSSTGSFDN